MGQCIQKIYCKQNWSPRASIVFKYFPDRKEHAFSLFINAKILPIAFLYWEAVCKLKLDVHNNRAPSNIMKIFTRTLNNYTYTYSSTSQLFRIRYSRCQNLEWDAKWIEKFVKEILQKRNKKGSSQYSRDWRFLYQAWWDNG